MGTLPKAAKKSLKMSNLGSPSKGAIFLSSPHRPSGALRVSHRFHLRQQHDFFHIHLAGFLGNFRDPRDPPTSTVFYWPMCWIFSRNPGRARELQIAGPSKTGWPKIWHPVTCGLTVWNGEIVRDSTVTSQVDDWLCHTQKVAVRVDQKCVNK